ncbi:hypothetical protein [Los Azufres archaeal virus 1]|nr:hypothetical protein [Los Azufres archaeal virus 1]
MSFKQKFVEGMLEGLITDPEVMYEIVQSIVTTLLSMVTIQDVVYALDKNIQPEEVFAKIPQDVIQPLKQHLASLSPAQKLKIKQMTIEYLTYDNVVKWLRAENVNLLAILLNHPNGKQFVNNFIRYINGKYINELLG